MRSALQLPLLGALCVAMLCVAGCGGGGSGNSGSGAASMTPAAPSGASTSSSPSMGSGSTQASSPEEGKLLSNPPAELASYDSADLLGLLAGSSLGKELLDLPYTAGCTIDVYYLEYGTIGARGEPTTASGALMVPSGSGTTCSGPRPIVLYAHGTSTDRNFDIADIGAAGDDEGLILAAVFAAHGYIVVAPNYAGYDTSTLTYHPYLDAQQQSQDMIDALTAARSALPVSSAPTVTDDHELFITGYSQGGFVAMATQRAMQAAGMTVTASGPMSGPYALAAFGDAIFLGEVNLSAVVNVAMLAISYQNAYGNLYSAPGDMFAPQYAAGIAMLLPSTTPVSSLYAEGKLPQSALFSSTPPAPQYASITPPTTPQSLAPVFALGFGTDFLVTNGFRLTYLQDEQANPDGGFPAVTTGVPAAAPADALRQDLKTNDLRDWSPTSPVLLCAGDGDPTVFYLNTQLMQSYWEAHPPAAPVTVLDLDAAVALNDPYAAEKTAFQAAKAAAGATGGSMAVLQAYHATLVPPFCLSAVKAFFDSQGRN